MIKLHKNTALFVIIIQVSSKFVFMNTFCGQDCNNSLSMELFLLEVKKYNYMRKTQSQCQCLGLAVPQSNNKPGNYQI